MGLQDGLSDVSTESIPVLLVVIVANCVCYLRSLLLAIFNNLGVLNPRWFLYPHQVDESLYDAVGSGLAGVVFLAEQLNMNRAFSYKFGDNEASGGDSSGSDCVVCLNRFGEGDRVRKLSCSHVFHKDCLDEWLSHLNFNCPLCRSPLMSAERVDSTRLRVGGDLLSWFSLRV